MFARYVHGGVVKKYAASMTKRQAMPAVASAFVSTKACLRRSVADHTRQIEKPTTMTGRTAAENFEAIAAPIANPTPRLLFNPDFQNRYAVKAANTARGTSVVTSIPCASKFGEKAHRPAANSPAAGPNISRAHRNTTNAPRAAMSVSGSRPQNRSRSASLLYMNRYPKKYSSPVTHSREFQSTRGFMKTSGSAARSFASGGCAGFILQSRLIQY